VSGAIRQRAHFVVIGETRDIEFREQQIAVPCDFECASAPRRDVDGRT
tara:strand:- start:132060 stop:132203 length:144 start_codon:yes stop_codon:yes gene_type:complete